MPELSLYDEIYFRLSQIEEFKNLSMDMQGEICIAVKKMIENKEIPLKSTDGTTCSILEEMGVKAPNEKDNMNG